MTLFDSIILGIVEGLTEFLPVSSTAHLVLASSLLKLKQDDFSTAYDIIIQLAPIFSVMLIYKERLFHSLALWYKLILAFIPTGIVGLFFHKQIEATFSANVAIVLMIITGIAFIVIELYHDENRCTTAELSQVSYKQAFYIGLFQILALVPGVSRSGSTILGAMLIGLKREVSMSFSFLLAIPTMGAASGYMFLKEYKAFEGSDLSLLAVGFVVSFVVGWLAVKGFLAYVSKYDFKPFGVYLIASALLFALLGIQV